MRCSVVCLALIIFAGPKVALADLPTIQLQPSDVQVHAGDSAVFQVVATGVDTLKWYVNGTLTGKNLGTQQRFVLKSVQLTQDKAKVHCVLVSKANGSRTSDDAVLSVLRPSREMMTFTGDLSDRFGNAVGSDAPKTIDMVVEIFRNIEGGLPEYAEAFLVAEDRGVPVQDGRFIARLGTGKITQGALESVVQQQSTLYVQFSIGKPDSREILSPRAPLTAMPYSIASSGGQIKGAGTPIALSIEAPVGTRYLDTKTNAIWVRSFKAWVKIP